MAWIFYICGILLIMTNLAMFGVICIIVGMIMHWKFWAIGLIAFFIGANL